MNPEDFDSEEEAELPGFPFTWNLLQDRYTLNKDSIDHFSGRRGRAIDTIDLFPILQQILTNQKEIVQTQQAIIRKLNETPEDKSVQEKFLSEFDKRMVEAVEKSDFTPQLFDGKIPCPFGLSEQKKRSKKSKKK